MKPVVAVVIPAYNEASRIKNTLIPLQSIELIDYIYVVDDGSTDGTVEAVRGLEGVHLIQHQVNQGKGAALQTGVTEAIEKADIILLLDADLEGSSIEANKLITPLLENRADVTIGRFPPAKKKGGFGLVKKLVWWGQKLHAGKAVASALSGQRALKKDVLKEIPLSDHGYGIELGMTINLLKKNFRILEVDVEMSHNETGRDWAGFRHRGQQFYQILKVIIRKSFEKT